MRQNKQIYIDFIIDELNKGNVKYNDICLLFCTKFDLTKQSFNNYWLKANETYTEQRQSIEAAKMEQTIKTEKESVTASNFKKEEALKMLSNTAKIFYSKIQENKRAADPRDATALCSVIDKIDRIEGWSIIKTELSGNVTTTYDKDMAEKLMNMVYNPDTKKFEKL